MKRIIIYSILALASISTGAQTSPKDSLVNMPWQSTMTEADRTGAVLVARQSDLEHYSISDIQGRLVGVMNTLMIYQSDGNIDPPGQYGTPIFSSHFTAESRLASNMYCVVDDVLVPVDQFNFEPDQIESITLIKDVADKCEFGPAASFGLFYVKTKKGNYNTRFNSTVDVEGGMAFAGIWPEWSDGYEYASLNNKARTAAGYSPLYDDAALGEISKGNPYDVQYPNVDYKSLMMGSCKPVSRFGYNANGGNNNIKFNFSLNGLHDNDLIKVGPVSDFSKLNTTSSITARIGNWIEANASFYGLLSFRRCNPSVSFSSYNSVPGVAFPLTLSVDESSPFYDPTIMSKGLPIYAVSRTFTSNPYATAIESGSTTSRFRSGMFNATVNVDMGWLLKGLKSSTFVNAGTFTDVYVGKKDDFIAYYWNPTDIIEAVTTHVGKKSSSKTLDRAFSYQTLNMNEKLSYDSSRNGNKVSAKAIFFINSSANAYNSAYERMMGVAGSVKYNYQDRYVAGLAANYTGVGRYHTGQRFGFFPSASFAWNASNEDFLKHNAAVNNLKVFVQAGQNGTNDFYGSNYLWQGVYTYNDGITYGPYVANSWFGNNTEKSSYTYISRMANHELTWPRITEVNVGFDATLFNCLDVSYEWYNMACAGGITQVAAQYSQVLGYANSTLYQNYNSSVYFGHELSLRYFKEWNDFGLSIGGGLMNWNIVDDKVANDFAIYDYQKLTGRHYGDYYALHCLGKFNSQEEIDSSPLYVANTKVGDLKYEDKNGDGTIDSNDEYKVGNTDPKLRYTLNLNLSYKKFNLNVVGQGVAFYDFAMTNSYFFSGWGDGNYSKFVLDDMYPGELSYVKNVNNFIASDYWLTNGGYFKLRNVELAYTSPVKKIKWIKTVRASLRGTNLFTLTSVPYVDPESPGSGISGNPLFRTFTFGVKFSF